MLLLALALFQVAPFDTKANQSMLIRRHCAVEWPNDFTMQAHCAKMALEGMQQFVAASKSVGRPLDKALEQCVEQWTKNRVPDWAMIGYCSKQQADAYLALNGERG